MSEEVIVELWKMIFLLKRRLLFFSSFKLISGGSKPNCKSWGCLLGSSFDTPWGKKHKALLDHFKKAQAKDETLHLRIVCGDDHTNLRTLSMRHSEKNTSAPQCAPQLAMRATSAPAAATFLLPNSGNRNETKKGKTLMLKPSLKNEFGSPKIRWFSSTSQVPLRGKWVGFVFFLGIHTP